MAIKKTSLKRHLCQTSTSSSGIDSSERKAVGVDEAIKASNLRRLSRIEGQIRGIQRMVEQDRYCVDILTQLSSAQEALRAVARDPCGTISLIALPTLFVPDLRKSGTRCTTNCWTLSTRTPANNRADS
jgi:hypothetical protein